MKIHELLERVVTDVVEMQEAFNRAHREDCEFTLPQIQELPILQPMIGEALLPPRMQLSRQQFNCKLEMRIRKSRKFEINCQYIPLKYYHLTERTFSLQQELQIQVEQIPLSDYSVIDSLKPKL